MASAPLKLSLGTFKSSRKQLRFEKLKKAETEHEKEENNYVLYVCVYTIGPVVMVVVVVESW